jgi:CRP/FNR family cyclic AMP-dependent transcriptional regulator
MVGAGQNEAYASLAKLSKAGRIRETNMTLMDGAPMFWDITGRQQVVLAGFMRSFEIEAGTTLFLEGDKSDFMCVIARGQVEVFKEDSQGRKKHLDTVGPGKVLGEVSLIDRGPRSSTAVLIALSTQDFDEILEKYPALGATILRRIAQAMSQRLRQVSGVLADHLEF